MTPAAQPAPSAAPAPAPRIAARPRRASEPGCAGCSQLGVFRALRRAGLDARGRSGCDAGPGAPLEPGGARWAAVAGAARALADADRLVREAAAAGARLLLVVDRDAADAAEIAALLARAGARAVTVDPRDPLRTEREIREAADAGGVAIVALSPCARRGGRRPPLAVAPVRCNRCGACLGLDCAALSDPGGEAMAIDPAVCTGCALCAPLCRAGALR